jgi:mRNA interferase MazF
VIRGAVYRIDLGDAKRGHEQRGRRLGLVLSPTSMPWSVATVIPTSTTAQPAVFRPTLHIHGQSTRFLVDQIRSIDTTYIHGDPVCYLDRDELGEVEHAVILYLGLSQHPTLRT